MLGIEKLLAEIGGQTVLCIGDLMLDDFVYGEVSRISPEAPAPVISVRREELVIGGAGNVARNIAALGARCIFIGVVGDDPSARTLEAALADCKGIEPHLVVDRGRPTTRKLRFVSEHHSTHLLRADWELAKPVDASVQAALIEQALAALPRADAVVLSDYGKGVLTKPLLRAVIEQAAKLSKPVVVDPKGRDFSIYRGATAITPNRKELAEATRHSVATHGDIATAAAELRSVADSEAVLVTLS
ncbi:MAG TPA: PfkB family carbohydrate kinase, partial [Bradyrhizobium sp.]|nr:PfkB family carbohydrate kinase [Bradyrhizobium sp.]